MACWRPGLLCSAFLFFSRIFEASQWQSFVRLVRSYGLACYYASCCCIQRKKYSRREEKKTDTKDFFFLAIHRIERKENRFVSRELRDIHRIFYSTVWIIIKVLLHDSWLLTMQQHLLLPLQCSLFVQSSLKSLTNSKQHACKVKLMNLISSLSPWSGQFFEQRLFDNIFFAFRHLPAACLGAFDKVTFTCVCVRVCVSLYVCVCESHFQSARSQSQ